MAAVTRWRVVAALAVAAVGFGAGFAIAHAGGEEKFPTPSLQAPVNSPPIDNLERATRLPKLRPATGGGGGGSSSSRSQPKRSGGEGRRTSPSPSPTTPSPTETTPPPTGTTPPPQPGSSSEPGY